jgi:hypothetical protein
LHRDTIRKAINSKEPPVYRRALAEKDELSMNAPTVGPPPTAL